MKFGRWIAAGAAVLSYAVAAYAEPLAQVPTETPAPINLSPVTQAAGEPLNPDQPTPTWTPTPQGIALLEAKEFANVRAEPSTESAQLGTIRLGETYNVIARYVSWLQFEFPSSPTGRGWVYGELVNLTGNVENIPEVDPYGQAAQIDTAASDATATQNAITQTPGGVLTATVISRELSAPGVATPTESGTREILPTFTYPPGMVAIAPTAGAALNTETADNNQPLIPASTGESLPPIVPIVLLGGVGLLGLAVSALRRG
jgi:hypothetical protein